MPSIKDVQWVAPSDWQAFERLSADLWTRIWNDPSTQMHGRQGQPQAGVDVYGRPDGGLQWAGVQCKGKDDGFGTKLTEAELVEEVEKAKSFVPPLIEDPETRRMLEYMDRAFVDCIFAAHGAGRVLISDDLYLRQFAGSKLSIPSIWVQPLLMRAREAGHLVRSKYNEAISSLAGSNYIFVSVDAGVLLYAAMMDGSTGLKQFSKMIGPLGGPRADLKSSISVVAGFLALLAKLPLPPSREQEIVFATLKALTKHHKNIAGALSKALLKVADGYQAELIRQWIKTRSLLI